MRKRNVRPDAERVRQERETKGWTMAELAGKADLSTKTVERIEGGRHSVRLSTLEDLAKALGIERGSLIKGEAEPEAEELGESGVLYLSRLDIPWGRLSDHKCKKRYWACGTSLRQIYSSSRVQNAHTRLAPIRSDTRAKDIRLIIPDTTKGLPSLTQLEQYDNHRPRTTSDRQVQSAAEVYSNLAEVVKSLEKGTGERFDYLRTYSGIMFSNITIFDDDAVVSFYDSTGVGDTNVTLHFNRHDDRAGFDNVVSKFDWLWDRSYSGQKKQTASIAFVNSKGEVLLALRDNKKRIKYPNKWDLLGGHFKVRENARKCIGREMQEEIGRKLKRPVLFNRYDLADRVEWMFWEAADINIKKTKLTEGQRLEWFSRERVARMADGDFGFGYREILLEFFARGPF